MISFSSYIDVAVTLPVLGTYTYGVPPDLDGRACQGCRVLVSFGHRRVTGYILGIVDQRGHDEIKPVLDVMDDSPLFPREMIPFFRWIADYYLHPIGQVIKTALPTGLSTSEYTRITIADAGLAAQTDPDTPAPMRAILKQLQSGPMRRHLIKLSGHRQRPETVLKKMKSKGWITTHQQVITGRTRSKTERVVRLIQPGITPMTDPRKKVIAALADQGDLPLADLKQIISTAAAIVRGLVKAGAVAVYERPVYRDPFGDAVRPDQPPVLTGDQQAVLKEITSALGKGFRPFLLAGVTGSGKTEIYLTLARKVLRKGGQVLVLVPEIALISQTERRFRARFGDRGAVLHSSLSSGERYDQWRRIVDGKTPIVIGA
ncbi:MAG: primosomal protein N', partial [Deltaproteobacteria bacterium]